MYQIILNKLYIDAIDMYVAQNMYLWTFVEYCWYVRDLLNISQDFGNKIQCLPIMFKYRINVTKYLYVL